MDPHQLAGALTLGCPLPTRSRHFTPAPEAVRSAACATATDEREGTRAPRPFGVTVAPDLLGPARALPEAAGVSRSRSVWATGLAAIIGVSRGGCWRGRYAAIPLVADGK